jgi:hypothetical protein
MANAMLGQASAFSLASQRETAATDYPFPYPSSLKKQVSSKAMGIAAYIIFLCFSREVTYSSL